MKRRAAYGAPKGIYFSSANPFKQINNPFIRIDNPFKRINDPFKRINNPFNRIDNPFKRIDNPFKRIDKPFKRIDNIEAATLGNLIRRDWTFCYPPPLLFSHNNHLSLHAH